MTKPRLTAAQEQVRKAQAKYQRERLESLFMQQLQAHGFEESPGLIREERRYVRQWRFHSTRKWALDFAFGHPALGLAVEIDGGTWSKGRHVRPKGYEEDCRKLNEALILGYAVLRFTGDMVRSGEAISETLRALDLPIGR